MKLNETHWLIKFLIGIGAGLAIGLGLSTPVIGVIIAIYVGTALTRGTWKVYPLAPVRPPDLIYCLVNSLKEHEASFQVLEGSCSQVDSS